MRRARPRLAAAGLAAALLVVQPAAGWTWGGDGHRYVARNYSQHLPPEIDGLRAYDAVVEGHVNDPDYRKSYTPGESYKHYMDIDAYPEFFSGTLPHDRAVLEARYGASTVLNRGVLPWAIGETVVAMTQQFQAAQWPALALTIADLCHYVGDGHQPLHCTKNFDGQFTGNYGIHSRYESTMLSRVVGGLHTDPMPVASYPQAVDAAFAMIESSWSWVDEVLVADGIARDMSGGVYDDLYYQALWYQTEGFTEELLDEATRATASYVHLAWVDAGRPPVPGSTVAVEPGAAAARLTAGPSPFREALTVRFSGEGPLAVEVFDARGARVAELARGARGAGSATWRPAHTGRAAAGLYFVRLRGPGVELVRRVALVP